MTETPTSDPDAVRRAEREALDAEIAAWPPDPPRKKTDYKRASQLVSLFYDFQRGRIAYEHRVRDGNEDANLSDFDKGILERIDKRINDLEKVSLKEANDILKGNDVYTWLIGQRGISITLAPVLMGSVDIHKTPTVSSLWRICGLAVDSRTGLRERPVPGEKLHYNPHLKSRCFLLGECMIKANNEQYRKLYDDYKHRKKSMRCKCALCDGTGVFVAKAEAKKQKKQKKEEQKLLEVAAAQEGIELPVEGELVPVVPGKPKKCPNCEGTGVGPWGKSDKHRHIASMRYMVKMFLADFWERWRRYEGLGVRPLYKEEYLGLVHHR